MADEGSQGGPATATETDGVISEPISVLVGATVAVTSGEENDNEDDVHEDKGSESVVERVKDGDEKEEEDDEYSHTFVKEAGVVSCFVDVSCLIVLQNSMLLAWSNLTDRRSVVVGFDLRSEEFSLITLPEDVQIVSRFESDLVRYNGKIALVNVSLTRKFDLWVLMDVKKHEWSKYSVVAPTCDFFRCRGTIETGELIFEQLYFGDQFSILYYDPKQDKARRVDLERSGDTTSSGRKLFVDHVESPMFLPRKFIH
ncbi:hypothetical protein F2Q70_00001730 [Brassica cretica]|uniref:F-box associated beta-propeller type 3 domain-containing protein n=1 Tax=Brassica cretica TaxID=69181 RepID=A0A8S9IL56_BRACR|nr:hypothetical protein F2Q70_00001730 [Brassica cretica]